MKPGMSLIKHYLQFKDLRAEEYAYLLSRTAMIKQRFKNYEKYTPLAPGRYSVLVPDAPHASNMTLDYFSRTTSMRADQVWFPIRHGNNGRYVHVGNVSEGCVTVLDIDRWPTVHEALISHRSPVGDAVADMTVRSAT